MQPFSATPPSPRRRRLESDLKRLQSLAAESSVFSYEVTHPMPSSGPPETYRVRFRGRSLQLAGGTFNQSVRVIHEHEVVLQLVADYPRSAPHMRWLTPIFHPNISAAGAVCLGGWGTHWAPSLQLDRLCEMLWDMLRFANYDTRSPFNQQAAAWLRSQREFQFPLENRELKDREPVDREPVDREPTNCEPSYRELRDRDPIAEAMPVAQIVREEPADTADSIRFDSPVRYHNAHRPAASRGAESAPPDILFLD